MLPFSEDGLTAPASVVYLVVAADLPHLDAADGRMDGSTELPSADDSDGDGIPDVSDPDDDNDGTPDLDDPCPLDSSDTCDDTTSVASLEVSGAISMTSIGDTIQLAATANGLDGSRQAVASELVHWVYQLSVHLSAPR